MVKVYGRASNSGQTQSSQAIGKYIAIGKYKQRSSTIDLRHRRVLRHHTVGHFLSFSTEQLSLLYSEHQTITRGVGSYAGMGAKHTHK